MLSVFMGVFCAIFVQGHDISSVGYVLQYGYISETGNAMVDELLTRGGLQSMMWTLSLILCSLSSVSYTHLDVYKRQILPFIISAIF